MLLLLLRLVILIAFLYLVRRVLSNVMGGRKNPAPKNSGQAPNQMVKDPVCGMYMDARLAVRLESKKEVVYFCSEKCRTKYLEVSSNAGIRSAAGSAPL
jgi:YHS domain-containing protein